MCAPVCVCACVLDYSHKRICEHQRQAVPANVTLADAPGPTASPSLACQATSNDERLAIRNSPHADVPTEAPTGAACAAACGSQLNRDADLQASQATTQPSSQASDSQQPKGIGPEWIQASDSGDDWLASAQVPAPLAFDL